MPLLTISTYSLLKYITFNRDGLKKLINLKFFYNF